MRKMPQPPLVRSPPLASLLVLSVGDMGARSSDRTSEGDEERVALRTYLHASVSQKCRPKQAAVLLEGVPIGVCARDHAALGFSVCRRSLI
jgi:hypothetical protein